MIYGVVPINPVETENCDSNGHPCTDLQTWLGRAPQELVGTAVPVDVQTLKGGKTISIPDLGVVFPPASPTRNINRPTRTLVDSSGNMRAVDSSGNALASKTDVESIQNNTLCVRSVPTMIERPAAGTATYRIELLLYDDKGDMAAPDSQPTIALVNQAGTDLSSRLDSATTALVSAGPLSSRLHRFGGRRHGAARVDLLGGRRRGDPAIYQQHANRGHYRRGFHRRRSHGLDAIAAKLPGKAYLAGTANASGVIDSDSVTPIQSGLATAAALGAGRRPHDCRRPGRRIGGRRDIERRGASGDRRRAAGPTWPTPRRQPPGARWPPCCWPPRTGPTRSTIPAS